jgi:hypothetical protein
MPFTRPAEDFQGTGGATAGMFLGGGLASALAGHTGGLGRTDDYISDATKLKAMTEALDRGGVSAKTRVDLTARAQETVFRTNGKGFTRGTARFGSTTRALVANSQALRAIDN